MLKFEPILNFAFTHHALLEMNRRKITREDVRDVLANPEQMEMVREGHAVYQAKRQMGDGQESFYYVSLLIVTVNLLMLLRFIERVRSRNIGDKL